MVLNTCIGQPPAPQTSKNKLSKNANKLLLQVLFFLFLMCFQSWLFSTPTAIWAQLETFWATWIQVSRKMFGTGTLMDTVGLSTCAEWQDSAERLLPQLASCKPLLSGKEMFRRKFVVLLIVFIHFCASQRWICSGDKFNYFCWK